MAWTNEVVPVTSAGMSRFADAPTLLWGDEQSGYVHDLINVVSPELLLLTVSMPTGSFYRYSSTMKALFDSDAAFYVISGEYTVQAPNTGEVCVAKAGDVMSLYGPEWYYGFNFETSECRVLEIISPPVTEASRPKYAAIKAPDKPLRGAVKAALARFPATGGEGERRLSLVSPEQALPTIWGWDNPIRLDVFVTGPRLSVAVAKLIPGKRSDTLTFSTAACVTCTDGELFLRRADGSDWVKMAPGDTYYLPAKTGFQLYAWGAVSGTGLISIAGNIHDDIVE